MTRAALGALARRLAGRVRFDVPLSACTTYRIGGPAAAVVEPASAADVAATLAVARDTGTRWLALGLGSNVLPTDRGFDGVVLRVVKGLDRVESGVGGDPGRWRVGAGLPTPLLAKRTANAGFAGVQRLIGVPGAVGGGVCMNAGAHGQEFRQVTRRVQLVDAASAEAGWLDAASLPWAYRSSGIANAVVIAVELELTPGEPDALAADIAHHFRWRKEGTPFDEACCGSVFRNPGTGRPPAFPASPDRTVTGRAGAAGARWEVGSPLPTAGRLIDACGLKGFRIGGAEVSRKHANYIVNVGDATAADVLAVIEAVRARVLSESGVALELEVKIVE